ncbi:MAG: single-stranded-DNA-specific exonuclease RecJ [Candidatus Dojkabacteria bacterium]|nr:single-stranded-DNA-specific exonuclease RecJ [Candidatus Dojkabacteria bacterium]
MSLQKRTNWIIPKKKSTDVLESITLNRDIKDVDKYISPSLEDIPSFKKLFGCTKAAKRIIKAIEKEQKILIHGDFDADGICATSLLWEFLYRDVSKFLKKKIDVIPYIPSRIDQGYGLTESSLEDIRGLGCKLLITVDCGVRDRKLIEKYKDIDFVITDHHQPPKESFEDIKYILVHQMLGDSKFPYQEISGSAVIYLVIQAIANILQMDRKVEKGLDLVALSTVTDIMPLLGVNRVFVKYGLEEIRKRNRLGLNALILRSGILPKDVDSYHLGYIIGPRINAAGRIGNPLNAVRLLVSHDEKQCKEISEELNTLNFDRQKLTMDVLEEAKEDVNIKDKLIFVNGRDWHEGIIGLVAGKLQEEYYKPTIVVSNVKGSARSIQGFNITKTLEKFSKYLERYGGHELAAGFTIKEGKLDEFKKDIIKYANEKLEKDIQRDIKIDLFLESDQIGVDLIKELGDLEPYGFGNPKPIIYLDNLVVVKKKVMGQDGKHMKLTVKGGGIDLLELVMFNCNDDVEKINEDTSIDVIGYPDINVWNGRENIQFIVREWRLNSAN